MSIRNINIGGLFRCCVETAANYDGNEKKIRCKHCNSPMIVGDDGNWQLDHDATLKEETKL